MGFILGSFCTRLYADLSIDPQISPNDPRWVGAWWLGLVIVSPLLMLASIAMFCFPKQLNNSHTLPKKLNAQSTSLKGIKNLLKCDKITTAFLSMKTFSKKNKKNWLIC